MPRRWLRYVISVFLYLIFSVAAQSKELLAPVQTSPEKAIPIASDEVVSEPHLHGWVVSSLQQLEHDGFLEAIFLPRWDVPGRDLIIAKRSQFALFVYLAELCVERRYLNAYAVDGKYVNAFGKVSYRGDLSGLWTKKWFRGAIVKDGPVLHKLILFFALDLEELGYSPFKLCAQLDGIVLRAAKPD